MLPGNCAHCAHQPKVQSRAAAQKTLCHVPCERVRHRFEIRTGKMNSKMTARRASDCKGTFLCHNNEMMPFQLSWLVGN